MYRCTDTADRVYKDDASHITHDLSIRNLCTPYCIRILCVSNLYSVQIHIL